MPDTGGALPSRRAVLALPLALTANPAAASSRGMAAAAHPAAAEAGAAMLRRGGSAADAAIAAALTLSVVEPYAAGIGGGGVAIAWSSSEGRAHAFDGLAGAPLRATPSLSREPDGTRISWDDLPGTGREVAVPALVPLLAALHARSGRLPWPVLVEPAIAAAREGYLVTPSLRDAIADEPGLHARPDFRALFLPSGRLPPLGATLRNAAQAEALAVVAREGAAALAVPSLSTAILRTLATAQYPSLMQAADLASASARPRLVLEVTVQGHRCIAVGAPANGGIAALQTLGMLERLGAASFGPLTIEGAHRMIEASRLSASDRRAFVGDPDFGPVPEEALLAPSYLDRRADLVAADRARGRYEAGSPELRRGQRGSAASDRTGTSHVAAIDSAGNAVSLTLTNNRHWGSGLIASGFVLNNGMHNFEAGTGRHPNRAEPRKRPSTSMAPLIVVAPDGTALLALGSGGGSRIVDAVVRSTMGLLAWGLDPGQAVALAHVGGHVGGAGELERGTAAEALAPGLQAIGHRIRVTGMNTGTQAVRLRGGTFDGGADPRRDGAVALA